jgi:hypothetical protein
MSTRSIILITGDGKHGTAQTIRLYKHSDGYPTGNLPIIAEALSKAKEQCKETNQRFQTDNPRIPSVEQVTGVLIGLATDSYGMGARLDDDGDGKTAFYNEKFKPKHLGRQGDLEWVYVVNLDNNTVKVFGGGYTGDGPQRAFKKGVVDPREYANQLKEEYQESELKAIDESIQAIEATGFKLNPKRKSRKKNKPAEVEPHEITHIVVPLKATA